MRSAASNAGNMGVAQGMDVLIDLAESLHSRRDIGLPRIIPPIRMVSCELYNLNLYCCITNK